MEIKEAILQDEINKIKEFLLNFDLKFEDSTQLTIYAEEDSQIVGTVSASGNLIKQLAVSNSMQGEDLASKLISQMLSTLAASGIYHYRVFTKPEYKDTFINLGFKPIVASDKFVALESGDGKISGAISRLSTKITMEMGFIEDDTAAIVINGNPFHEGHLSLCEYAMKRHKRLIVFIVEEDDSLFTFKERFSMAYLALKPYANVIVLPSTDYIVSKSTFPSYFLKSVDETTEQFATYDALIFKEHFMPALGIKKRYFGSESSDYMVLYNNVVSRILGDGMEIVPRFSTNDEVISAKRIRKLIEEKNYEEALKLIPQSCRGVMSVMLKQKFS